MANTVEVVVGRVVKAHGVRGDVVVELHTDEPKRRFAPGTVLTFGDAHLRVHATRAHGERLVVTFNEITTRDAAESLVGAELVGVVQADAIPDDAAEFYDRHLVGLSVCRPDGAVAGVVEDVVHGPAQDLLVVATDAGQRLVPFVADLVPSVDLAAGRLTVADIPGLLDDQGD